MKLKTLVRYIISIAFAILWAGSVDANTYTTVNGFNVTYTYETIYDGAKITAIDSSYSDVSIPDSLDGYRVTCIESLGGCTVLTSVEIPDSVTVVHDEAFKGCTSLTSVSMLDTVQLYGNPFEGTRVSKFVVRASGSTASIVVKDNVLFSADGGRLIACPIKKLGSYIVPYGVYSIESGAFKNCTKLTSVEIPDSVTDIGTSAFEGCTGLKSVTIPDEVTNIGDGAFCECTSLASVSIPSSLTQINTSTFEGCTSLKSVTISNSVTDIYDGAFRGCTGLTSVIIPDGVTYIRSSSFENCSSLKSVTIPDSVTDIGGGAFCGCTGLTSVTIPDSVTCINYSVFEGCTSLKSVTIPNNVTDIYDGAFRGCTGLTSVTIPDSVTCIASSVFEGCTSLASVIFLGNCGSNGESFELDLFSGCTKLKQIFVPEGFSGQFSNLPIACEVSDVIPQFEVNGAKDYYDVGEIIDIEVPVSSWYYAFKVTGLPKGVSSATERWMDGIAISGVPTEAGFFTITITATKSGLPTVTKQIPINVGMMKVEIEAIGSSMGKKSLTKSGYFSAGKTAAIKAEAEKGYVFAGWYQDNEGGTPCDLKTVDYRTASVNYPMPTSSEWDRNEPIRIYAKFVSAEEDAQQLTAGLDGMEWDVEGEWSEQIYVDSITVPTVKMTGLPNGITFDANTLVLSGKPTTPGVYEVTATLSNTSIKNKTEIFVIRVPNLDSDYIYPSWGKDDEYEVIAGWALGGEELTAYTDVGWFLKIDGLPAGLTYNSQTGGIIGVPTKVGKYTVTITATTEGMEAEVATRTISVVPRTLWLSVDGDEESVKTLTGAGEYIVGEKVALKAVANPGYVFAGWSRRDDLGVDYRTANITYTMPNDDVFLSARFVREEEDAAQLTTYNDGNEVTVDREDWEYEFSVDSITVPTVKVTGLPKGLALISTNDIYKIYGTCTEPGLYEVTLTLSNASIKEKIETFKIRVPNLNSDYIYTSWEDWDDYNVTAGVELGEGELTADVEDGWTLKVTGLPDGLTYNSKTAEITGTPKKVGNYTVTFTATTAGMETEVATRTIVVVGRTIGVSVVGDEEGMKTLTGGGTYAVGEKVALKAVANTGYVFAGWYSWYDNEDSAEAYQFDGIDYRTAAITYTMPNEDVFLFARFVSAAEDAERLGTGLDGIEEIADGDWEYQISVDSISAATVKVTGLPKGLAYDAKTGMISGKPTSPGVYTVTLMLSNASVKSKVETFTITVPNVSGEAIHPSWGEWDNVNLLAGRALGEYELYAGVDDGWTLKVAGLPAGLTYNSKTDEITGKPTKVGTYTVTFTATKKGEETQVSTRTIVVEPVRMELGVIGEEDGKKTLTGAGDYAVGAKASLKAAAEKGYVFAGWYWDEDGTEPCEDFGVDYRTANVSYTMAEDNVVFYAKFVSAAEDAEMLTTNLDGIEETVEGDWEYPISVDSITVPTVKVAGLPKGLTFDAKKLVITGTPTVPGVYTVTVTLSNTSIKNKTEKFTIRVPNLDSPYIYGLNNRDEDLNYTVGLPSNCKGLVVQTDEDYTLKVTGLPAGLKYDSKTGEITGAASKAGTYTVTFTATKGKDVQTSTRTFVVAALPSRLVGTYTGFVRGYSGDGKRGTFTLTATDAGKVTAKVIDAKGTYSFTGAWDCGSSDGYYYTTLKTSKGEELYLDVNLGNAWNDASCRGSFYNAEGDNFTIEARKNPLADKWYMKATADGDGFWNFTFVETAKEANLTVTPKGDGTVAIAGKIGTYSVSASSILSFDQLADGNGMFQADFVTFATVNREKKALSISCELWFNHPAGEYAGFATLVE